MNLSTVHTIYVPDNCLFSSLLRALTGLRWHSFRDLNAALMQGAVWKYLKNQGSAFIGFCFTNVSSSYVFSTVGS